VYVRSSNEKESTLFKSGLLMRNFLSDRFSPMNRARSDMAMGMTGRPR